MFMLQGASVIRMLEDFLGEEEFKNGITNFLNRFKFANAVTQDLWEELQQVQKDVNITRVMDTWTRQMGYPVVTATRGSNGTITLQQTRFLSDPDAAATDSSPYG
jgi:aminopeptidase N